MAADIPSKDMLIVGITGSFGKTTVGWLVRGIMVREHLAHGVECMQRVHGGATLPCPCGTGQHLNTRAAWPPCNNSRRPPACEAGLCPSRPPPLRGLTALPCMPGPVHVRACACAGGGGGADRHG